MAPKRKHEEDEAPVVHESRQFQVLGSAPKAAKKPRRFEPTAPRVQIHASSVNAIKKRIRDVSRKLERVDDLPPQVRVENERALAGYEQELIAAEAEKIRQKMISKYHMVRFFERKKAERNLKKLRKQLLEAKSADEIKELENQIHITEVDYNYTQNFPLSEIYISLYPLKEDGQEISKDDTARPKPPMWEEIKRRMEEGTLSELRNRVSIAPIVKKAKKPEKFKEHVVKPAKPKATPASVDTTGMNRRQRRKLLGVSNTGPTKTKHKSIGFEKNAAFGAAEAAKFNGYKKDEWANEGGFFEE
ncbi:hypothetical protein BJ878DRAFT_459453 [Calycina marina]|uniref:rRNA-processing protein EFG1 n=1 Tax=Calycina marina TaxID=1763456 RepID=A0A9P7Z3Z2_9HELO|nr:hypothetical protein BJ878DRAFT_459453 [Calycina marina]